MSSRPLTIANPNRDHADAGDDDHARDRPVRDLRRQQDVADQDQRRDHVEDAVWCEDGCRAASGVAPSAPGIFRVSNAHARELADPSGQHRLREQPDPEGGEGAREPRRVIRERPRGDGLPGERARDGGEQVLKMTAAMTQRIRRAGTRSATAPPFGPAPVQQARRPARRARSGPPCGPTGSPRRASCGDGRRRLDLENRARRCRGAGGRSRPSRSASEAMRRAFAPSARRRCSSVSSATKRLRQAVLGRRAGTISPASSVMTVPVPGIVRGDQPAPVAHANAAREHHAEALAPSDGCRHGPSRRAPRASGLLGEEASRSTPSKLGRGPCAAGRRAGRRDDAQPGAGGARVHVRPGAQQHGEAPCAARGGRRRARCWRWLPGSASGGMSTPFGITS